MAKRSDIHFQRGVSLAKFHENYSTEEKCTSALFRLKWPKGFAAPSVITTNISNCDVDLFTSAENVATRLLFSLGQFFRQQNFP